MQVETKVDLPPSYRTRKVAEMLSGTAPYGTRVVYLSGHGAKRDWEGGVGRIFSEYLDNLVVVFVAQDDFTRPGGYRPILVKNPRNLRVKGASAGILYDTSNKELTVFDDVEIPTSSSQSGRWLDILRFAEYLEIPVFFDVTTTDYLGTSTISIEPAHKEKNRPYLGPRKFLELNLPSFKFAAEALKDKPYEIFREQLVRGGILPTRLRRYEKYLRSAGAWNGNKPLEDVVIPNLGLIYERDFLGQIEDDLISIASGVLRHA